VTDQQLSQRIVAVLQEAFPKRSGSVALHEPNFTGNEWNYVKECIDTGWVSSAGKYVDKFENDLAEFTGAPYAVAVVNGTAALHISLLLAGVEAGQEVIIPSLTFVATPNAVSYCGAIPHFAEVSSETLGLDPELLDAYLRDITTVNANGETVNKQTNRVISAVVPMHTFGHPADLDALLEVCERYKLTLVEDAAESLGSYYKSRHTGTYGLLGAFSFNGNKIVTTGGGGAIVTTDKELARQAKHLTTTAKVAHKWAFWHDHVGYNYRMPNLNAALGCAQLERLSGMISEKRNLAHAYRELFRKVDEVRIQAEPAHSTSNYWLNALILKQPDSDELERILGAAHEAGFLLRPIWTPMHKLPMYRSSPSMPLPVTEMLEKSVVNLPSGSDLVGELSKW